MQSSKRETEGKRGRKEQRNANQPESSYRNYWPQAQLFLSLSIITLNADGRNSSIKVIEWQLNNKIKPNICCLQQTHFSFNDRGRQRGGVGKDAPCEWKFKNKAALAGVARLVQHRPCTKRWLVQLLVEGHAWGSLSMFYSRIDVSLPLFLSLHLL